MHGVTLVFDLDGTLIDTAPDLIGAANHVLAHRGLSPVAAAKLRPQISFGARKIIMRGLAEHGLTLPDKEIDGLLANFLTFYAQNKTYFYERHDQHGIRRTSFFFSKQSKNKERHLRAHVLRVPLEINII